MLKKDLEKRVLELEIENKELKSILKAQKKLHLIAQKKYQKTEKGKERARRAAKKYYEKKKKQRELEKLKLLKNKYEKVDSSDSIEDTITEDHLSLQEQEQMDLFLENPAKYGIKPDKTANYTISIEK